MMLSLELECRAVYWKIKKKKKLPTWGGTLYRTKFNIAHLEWEWGYKKTES